MKKTYLLAIVGIIGIVTFIIAIYMLLIRNDEIFTMEGTVMGMTEKTLSFQDSSNVIYTFKKKDLEELVPGDSVIVSYTGKLDANKDVQDVKIVSYTKMNKETNDATTTEDNDDENKNDSNGIPDNWNDNGMFKQYYKLAYDKVSKMTLDEKIGQLIIARYPTSNAIEDLKKYNLGGYIFFKRDVDDKTEEQVQKMLSDVQKVAKIPLLTAVDEEGGSVSRIGANNKLVKEPFKSPQDLYNNGGFDNIKDDTINKSKILKNLGFNLNLAPVVDVATDENAYMYNRTIGLDVEGTSKYAKTVIDASKDTGVSYTLKHFPGYGNAGDSHQEETSIAATYEDLVANYFPPFQAGADAGADSILVNHNIYTNVDSANPASLSKTIHNYVRKDLKFTGIVMTDNLDMGAVANIDDAVVKAILAGNDMVITSDYVNSIKAIKNAVQDGDISEDTISKLAFRVIAWKYYKGIMFENQK